MLDGPLHGVVLGPVYPCEINETLPETIDRCRACCLNVSHLLASPRRIPYKCTRRTTLNESPTNGLAGICADRDSQNQPISPERRYV
jgi:hypothetical protein